MPDARRVTVIAHELRGFRPVGGMGTATTFLALALARLGHSVEILLGKHAPAARSTRTGRALYDERRHPDPARPAERRSGRAVALRARARRVARTARRPRPTSWSRTTSALRRTRRCVCDRPASRSRTRCSSSICHGPRRWMCDLYSEPRDRRSARPCSASASSSRRPWSSQTSSSARARISSTGCASEAGGCPNGHSSFRTSRAPSATGEPPAASPRPSRDPAQAALVLRARRRAEGREAPRRRAEAARAERCSTASSSSSSARRPGRGRARASKRCCRATKRALGGRVRRTELDQHEALDRLRRPGTLVVMPSLQDNSPNTVYECLERTASRSSPATSAASPSSCPATCSFEPTPEGLEAALRRVLSDGNVPAPAQPAFERDASRRALARGDRAPTGASTQRRR